MASSAKGKRTKQAPKPKKRTARKPNRAPVSQPSLPPAAPEATPVLPVVQTVRTPASPTGKVPLRYCPNPLCNRPNYSSRRKKCATCQTELPPVPVHASVAKLGNDSLVRTKALHIVAMRLNGMSTDEIAAAMKLSKQTVYGYIYRATRNGWIGHDTPSDRIEFSLGTKAIDALEELLEDEDTSEKTRAKVALGVMEYVAPKKADANSAVAQTVVAIRIEQPGGTPQEVRPGAISGVAAYIDAEVVKHGDAKS